MKGTWWYAKNSLGILLIANMAVVILTGKLTPLFDLPVIYGQAVVLLGGGISILHYLLLKRRNSKLCQPQQLVTSGGFYSFIRHPMYLGEALLYLGLWIMASTLIAMPVLLLGILALVQQARNEDRLLQQQFGNTFDNWKAATALLLPCQLGRYRC